MKFEVGQVVISLPDKQIETIIEINAYVLITHDKQEYEADYNLDGSHHQNYQIYPLINLLRYLYL